MSKVIDVEVLIGDKQYTISGAEGSEYIQKIAAHINDKLAEFKKQEGYATLDVDMKNILLAINLSDDYYKAVQELQEARAEYQDKEREIFDMKHELVSMQTKMDKLTEEADKLREQQNEEEHSVIRMEAKYEQASRNEEKSRLELTRLEKRLKMIQESEQRAQARRKELEQELEEQKKLVQELKELYVPEETDVQEIVKTDSKETEQAVEDILQEKPDGVGKEIAATTGKTQGKKSSRNGKGRRR